MYSWEIQQLMELKNYIIYVDEYLKICNTSPQIREINYNAFEDKFHIATDDRYDFNFKVKKRERK